MYYESEQQRAARRQREDDEHKARLASIRAEAERIVEQQMGDKLAQAQNQRLWANFFFHHPDIEDHEGNKKLLFDYALSLSDDGVVTLQHLDEASKLSSLDRKAKQVLTATSAKQDEETLQEFCKANRLHSNIAALNQLRQEFGAGFNFDHVRQALQSGSIGLGPATQEELAVWAEEDQEQRIDFLVNRATPQQLKEVARVETEQRRAAAVQQQADQALQASIARDAAMGYEPIPENFRGQKLDATFIKMCDVATTKLLLKRYGSAQLDLRLRGQI